MVLIGPSRRQQDAEDVEMKDEDPDWCEPGHQEDDWQFGSYDEIELRLRDDLNVKNLHAVDVVSIGTKNNPIPLKEVDDEHISGYEGEYCGHNPVIPALKKDTFEVKLENRLITTSRWAMCEVRQELRNQETCGVSDHMAQFYRKHGGATIIAGVGNDAVRTTPAE